ncbi:hypothetical protein [uncultured Sphingomonas sp.]|uniref:hypothetical protein n=1 Tax=uncultured Sphingomonas sp. TaxID=158754 RepID=UPI0025E7C5E2|nr:hypothetical protein [uncultured Sphingomonas sp.]
MAKVGRPAEGKAAKNAPLNMRTSPDLRAKIEAAADANGRSLTQEVERRLITSFIFDDSRGGPHIGAFANMVCAVIQNVELDTGVRWMDDFDTFARVRGAVERLLEWRNPGMNGYERVDDLRKTMDAARVRMEDATEALTQFRSRHEKTSTGRRGLFGASMKTVSREEWTADDFAEEDSLIANEQEARADWSKAEQEWRVAFDADVSQMEDQEQIGRSMADVIFDQIGPREPKGAEHGA